MRLMCWDIDIIHQNDMHLANADYWLQIGKDVCFDPYFRDYLQFDRSLGAEFPSPTDLPILPQNMPYYRGPHIPSQVNSSVQDADVAYCQTLLSTIIGSDGPGLTHLSHIPVWFGEFDTITPATAHASNNYNIPCFAQQVLQFSWAVYSFGGGHFALTISSRNLPFCVKIACDQYKSGGALFQEFTSCNRIFISRDEMLDYIRASGDTFQIHGYLIHASQFTDSDATSTFWQLQSTIVAQLRSLHDLQVVVAIVHPDHDGQSVKSFVTSLKPKCWKISWTDVSFPEQGNTIAGICQVIIGVHSSSASTVEPLLLKEQPPTPPHPISLSIWEAFNRREHSVSLAKDNDDFICQDVCFTATSPKIPSGLETKVHIK
jgi:hypothetical protein